MEKAFDVKALVEKMKAAGLPLAEDMIEKEVAIVLDWVKESSLLHENALVKALVPMAVEAVKPMIMAQVDKIDGQVG